MNNAAREAFLQEILGLDPEYATGLARGQNGVAHKMIWNEANLRQCLGIPATPPSPVHFTIDIPNPLGENITPYASMRFIVTTEALARAAAMEVEKGIVAGAWSEVQRQIDENQQLRERIALLEGGMSIKTPSAYLIAEEVARAREKYPMSNFHDRIDGFVQEAGEAMQALLKLKHNGRNIGPDGTDLHQHARLEVIQAAGQCVRLLDEAL